MEISPTSWWEMAKDAPAQGEYLEQSAVPIIPADFGLVPEPIMGWGRSNAIIASQSCDLDQDKMPFVLCCPIYPSASWPGADTSQGVGELNEIRKGRIEYVHMLAGFDNCQDHTKYLIADFRGTFMLPRRYIDAHVKRNKKRQRLMSPYIEHFSQAFGRFFTRVALPGTLVEIPKPPKATS